MAALESASAGQNIAPLAKFLTDLVQDRLRGKEVPPTSMQ